MTGHVGTHGVGAIGRDRVGTGRTGKRHILQVINRQTTIRFPFRHPFGQDARAGAVRNGQAIADEQNHVLGFTCTGRGINVPAHLCFFAFGFRFDDIFARFRQVHVSQPDRGGVAAVFTLNKRGRFAQHLLVIFAVDQNADIFRLEYFIKLDFKIEFPARQHGGAVNGINGLSLHHSWQRSRNQ